MSEDGVRIAYCVTGEGPPLVACPHLIESFALDHMVPKYELFMDALARNARLIRFDTRGTGLSDQNVTDFSLEALMRDIDAVITAAGADSVDLWGAMGSVMRAVGYAVQRPQRVRNLVLYEAHSSGADWIKRDNLMGLAALARSDWWSAAHAMAGSGHLPAEYASGVHNIGEWNRQSTTGEAFAGLFEALSETNVADLLNRVTTPTLILHPARLRFVSMQAAQNVAKFIAGSRMRIMEAEGPLFGSEDMARETADAVDNFLHPRGESAHTLHPTSPFRTVLFTDLVGHTEMMQRLGDAKGRDVLREHERITRDTLREHGGVELKTDGDSFMVSFGSVTAAMDCAIALQRAFAQHNETSAEPIAVRMGLNAGEPIEEDGDLFGSSVILAARIAAQAEAGEILIAEPVRHLLSGKNFVYADRGETVLKGFEDAVRLYEVRWRK
jgi:class 3 adenylate cyclase